MNGIKSCALCPRECGVDREKTAGYCGVSGSNDAVLCAKAMLHYWEEPPISGKEGSGAVFFSGCNMKCRFCQNYEISSLCKGREITVSRLADIFLELQEKGANNINLVTATHFIPQVLRALDKAKPRLSIPVVYNCGGYEKAETIRLLDGYVDIFLPDLKYFDDGLAVKYSSAPGYFGYAFSALEQMLAQTGEIVCDERGIMKKGVIVRHMILPGQYKDSIRILEKLAELDKSRFFVSIMRQFTPCFKCGEYPELNRRLTTFEYDKVTEKCLDLGLTGFMQEKSSASREYTPDFDFEGL